MIIKRNIRVERQKEPICYYNLKSCIWSIIDVFVITIK